MEPVEKHDFTREMGIWGGFFGLVMFLISTIAGYATIHSEPTGSLVGFSEVGNIVGCLIGALGGLLAVRMHVRSGVEMLTFGRGALIGGMTGVVMAVVATFLGTLWHAIDPQYNEQLMEATIANIEAMDQLPESQREEFIDQTFAQFQEHLSFQGIMLGLGLQMLTLGVLNIITGLLGTRFFASQP